jgi:riboflavin synthase
MFTGIIEGLGKISKIDGNGKEIRFKISPKFEINDYKRGESIAVNGVCLTVESFGDSFFNCYASKETVDSTSFSGLKINSVVNLERAMKVGDRFGGHIVSGHVDGTAEITNIENANSSIRYTIKISKDLEKFVVAKGSITLDGISLTINKCEKDIIDVNIIPETQGATNIKNWKIGDKINIETDMIGKYVYKNLSAKNETKKESITTDFLMKNGFVD